METKKQSECGRFSFYSENFCQIVRCIELSPLFGQHELEKKKRFYMSWVVEYDMSGELGTPKTDTFTGRMTES